MNTILNLGALILKGGHLLVARRKLSPFLGQFTTPGGKLDPGETYETGLKREVLEETGIRVLTLSQRRAVLSCYPNEGLQIVSVYYEAKLWEGDPKNLEPDKHEDWMWVLPTVLQESSHTIHGLRTVLWEIAL